MSKLKWDESGKRYFEAGVSKGVLYPMSADAPGTYNKGVAWSGLTAVTESPSGAEPNPLYADNIKYLNLMSVEELEATIEAYTYPDEFAACDGSSEIAQGAMIGQQKRLGFALCYQTKLGNDQDSELGFKLHILFGAMASPSERGYESVNDSPDAMTFSWEVTTTPVEITGFKPTALVTIDSTKADPTKLATLLEKLYGKDAVPAVPEVPGDPEANPPTETIPAVPEIPAVDPTLVMPDEIITILGAVAG